MKLHTALKPSEVVRAMINVKARGQMTNDVEFVQFERDASRSHAYGYLLQLGTYDKTTGPTRSRRYKRGTSGADLVWAATYDEWGWLIAELFRLDPSAKFGHYKNAKYFHEVTEGKFESVSCAADFPAADDRPWHLVKDPPYPYLNSYRYR